MVEIARNLNQDDLRVLIMDEPTSSLSAAEVKVLFKIMRELLEAGISIVYISHRLEEIMEIGDHVTILRDGKYVADADVKDIELSCDRREYGWKEHPVSPCLREALTFPNSRRCWKLGICAFRKKAAAGLLTTVSLDLKKARSLVFTDFWELDEASCLSA